jgi:hypothetical protein
MLKSKRKFSLASENFKQNPDEKFSQYFKEEAEMNGLHFLYAGNEFYFKRNPSQGEQAKGRIITDLFKGYVNACVTIDLKDKNELICEIIYTRQLIISLLVSVLSGVVLYYVDGPLLTISVFVLVTFILSFFVGAARCSATMKQIIERTLERVNKSDC